MTGKYSNGFIPGEKVQIDMPGSAMHGMQTEVVAPAETDMLEPEDVLVRNPAAPGWILRLYEGCLVKDWAACLPSGDNMGPSAACALR